MIAWDLYRDARDRLRNAGIDTAELDARLLLHHVTGLAAHQMDPRDQTPLPSHQIHAFAALLDRRAKGEPLAYLTGRQEFWSLDLLVTRDVLIPRPDSETLISALLDQVGDRQAPRYLLDLGTGSGCLLLALLSELPNARGVGIDLSDAALDVARQNGQGIGMGPRCDWRQGDWTAVLQPDERFDIILSNPPYIAEGDDRLAANVKAHEPHQALFAGADGLAVYRLFARSLAAFLADDGVLGLEVGAGQAEPVTEIFTQARWHHLTNYHDLAGVPRALLFRR